MKTAIIYYPNESKESQRNFAVNHHLNRLDQKFSEFLILHSNDLSKYTTSYMKDYGSGNNLTEQRTVLKFVDDYFINSVMKNVS